MFDLVYYWQFLAVFDATTDPTWKPLSPWKILRLSSFELSHSMERSSGAEATSCLVGHSCDNVSQINKLSFEHFHDNCASIVEDWREERKNRYKTQYRYVA